MSFCLLNLHNFYFFEQVIYDVSDILIHIYVIFIFLVFLQIIFSGPCVCASLYWLIGSQITYIIGGICLIIPIKILSLLQKIEAKHAAEEKAKQSWYRYVNKLLSTVICFKFISYLLINYQPDLVWQGKFVEIQQYFDILA
jgi:ABC-type antimicrobial peptide transport system permease subunit